VEIEAFLEALDLGGDYLTKPFWIDELLARMRAAAVSHQLQPILSWKVSQSRPSARRAFLSPSLSMGSINLTGYHALIIWLTFRPSRFFMPFHLSSGQLRESAC
jgi:DNA-binding response OmpR family regulator